MTPATDVATGILTPALEARACNIEQHRLLYNSSPQADSLIELLTLLRVPPEYQPLASRLLNEIVRSNASEGAYEKTIAGNAEQLANDLHRQMRGKLSAQSIARRLRGPLKDLLSDDPAIRLDAFTDVAATLKEIPRQELLRSAVAYELGKKLYPVLERLCTDRRSA